MSSKIYPQNTCHPRYRHVGFPIDGPAGVCDRIAAVGLLHWLQLGTRPDAGAAGAQSLTSFAFDAKESDLLLRGPASRMKTISSHKRNSVVGVSRPFSLGKLSPLLQASQIACNHILFVDIRVVGANVL
ncbi:hypothetical protein AcV5_000701 [Taiwanofungus camphoratus]|nr:hypothetical protein AcV5_000701 [Antrodia cinnamomea]